MDKRDLERSCLLIVDIMNDFVKPEGAFPRMGYSSSPPEETETMIRNNQRLIAAMRAAGRPIVYVRGEYRPDSLDAAWSFMNRVLKPLDPNIPYKLIGTWGPQIIDELEPEPEDVIVIKKGHSGYGFTELDPMLRRMGIEKCVATGGGSQGCLSDTVREGAGHGYYFYVVRDATYQLDHPVLVELAATCGQLTTTEDVLGLIESGR